MSTRKLIIASLICGLLILVAGSVKLLQTATDDTDLSTLFAVGTTREISGISVTVNKVQVTADQTLVDFTMVGLAGQSPLAGWSMLANGEINAPLSTTQCLAAPGDITCTLEFVVAVGTPTIVYARDGEKTQWLGA